MKKIDQIGIHLHTIRYSIFLKIINILYFNWFIGVLFILIYSYTCFFFSITYCMSETLLLEPIKALAKIKQLNPSKFNTLQFYLNHSISNLANPWLIDYFKNTDVLEKNLANPNFLSKFEKFQAKDFSLLKENRNLLYDSLKPTSFVHPNVQKLTGNILKSETFHFLKILEEFKDEKNVMVINLPDPQQMAYSFDFEKKLLQNKHAIADILVFEKSPISKTNLNLVKAYECKSLCEKAYDIRYQSALFEKYETVSFQNNVWIDCWIPNSAFETILNTFYLRLWGNNINILNENGSLTFDDIFKDDSLNQNLKKDLNSVLTSVTCLAAEKNLIDCSVKDSNFLYESKKNAELNQIKVSENFEAVLATAKKITVFEIENRSDKAIDSLEQLKNLKRNNGMYNSEITKVLKIKNE